MGGLGSGFSLPVGFVRWSAMDSLFIVCTALRCSHWQPDKQMKDSSWSECGKSGVAGQYSTVEPEGLKPEVWHPRVS